jgi:hypothetical protein
VSLDLVIFDVLVPPAGIELLNSKTPGFKEIYKEEVRCLSSLSTLHSTPKLLAESEILKPHLLLNQSWLRNTPVTSLQASITASRELPSWE